jgi:hypothetical protein
MAGHTRLTLSVQVGLKTNFWFFVLPTIWTNVGREMLYILPDVTYLWRLGGSAMTASGGTRPICTTLMMVQLWGKGWEVISERMKQHPTRVGKGDSPVESPLGRWPSSRETRGLGKKGEGGGRLRQVEGQWGWFAVEKEQVLS